MALSDDLCKQNLKRILEKACQLENFIRLDMEESQYVDRTLAIYRYFRSQDYDNLGIVIQSYLYRSEADLIALKNLNSSVRLCKGAYQELPDRAYPKKSDVDANYDRLVRHLFDQALAVYQPGQPTTPFHPPIPAIATHDLIRITTAKAYANSIALPKDAFEFQMLYGIRRDLQENLIKEGYRVRVYVPFGARWYPYFMRRLAERPANIWFFVSNYFRK